MEITVLRSVVTLVSFAVFIGIVYWAWSDKNKFRFDEAANLPFADDDAELPLASKNVEDANHSKKVAA